MAAGGTHESTSVIVLNADPGSRTPVGLTHRLKLMHGPTGWIATAFHDPHLAFAELCLRERAQASRAAWGLQRVEKLSMVIVDPLRCPSANDLVASIKRYTPTVSVWSYRDGQLQAVAAARSQQASAADHAMTVLDAEDEPQAMSDSSPAAATALASRSPQMSSRPLRLAGVDDQSEHMVVAAQSDANDDADANGRRSGSGSSASSASVTREEIDLLLQRGAESSTTGGGDGSRGSTGIPA